MTVSSYLRSSILVNLSAQYDLYGWEYLILTEAVEELSM